VPSTSKKQAKLMAAVAHNPAFAKKVGIPQSVGKEFNKADKGRKFGRGGDMIKEYGGAEKYKSKAAMKKHEAAESPAKEKAEGKKAKMGSMQKIAARAVKSHEKRMHKGMAKGGSVDGCATRGKTKGHMV
jgi:hypothetical protein